MRILITGDSGTGKTTLARNLSIKTKILCVETDDIHFEKKYTLIRPDGEKLALIDKVYAKKNWIVEGTTRNLIRRGIKNADIVLLCEHTNLFKQLRLVLVRGAKRKDESIIDTIKLLLYLIRRYYSIGDCKGKPRIRDELSSYKEKVVELKSFKEMDDYLTNFKI